MMNPERARALLGVDEGDDLGAVRSAYEDLLRRHPTLEDPPSLDELRQAFEVLQELALDGEGPAELPSLGDGAVTGAGGEDEEASAPAGESLAWTPRLSTTGSGDDGGDRVLGTIGESTIGERTTDERTTGEATADERFGSWRPEFPWKRRLGGGTADEPAPDEPSPIAGEETPPAGAAVARDPVPTAEATPPPPPSPEIPPAPRPDPPPDPDPDPVSEETSEAPTGPAPAPVRWATTDDVGAGDWRLRYSRGQASANRGCLVGLLAPIVTALAATLLLLVR